MYIFEILSEIMYIFEILSENIHIELYAYKY